MEDDSPVAHEDLVLVRRALAGEAAAVEAVVDRLRCVHRFLAARNGRLGEPFDPGELEDIAQDVLIAAWNKLHLFRGHSSLEGWLQRFTHLELIYNLRRKDRRPERLAEPGQAAVGPAEVPEPDEVELLHLALEELDAEQADVVRLKHFEDLTFQEIAARLGLPANTAKTRYYRGVQRLRGILERRRRRSSEVTR